MSDGNNNNNNSSSNNSSVSDAESSSSSTTSPANKRASPTPTSSMEHKRVRAADDAASVDDGASAATGTQRSTSSTTKKAYTTAVFDIEGTTTPITFVANTLFPYIRRRLDDYLAEHYPRDAQTRDDVAALRTLAATDRAAGTTDAPLVDDEPPSGAADADADADAAHARIRAQAAANVRWQMDSDRKSTALKALQGHMWRAGYASGELVGELYDDVEPYLRSLRARGVRVFIYSSGSVEAQRLLFAHTRHGDMLPLFAGHFDTKIGAKRERASYTAIAAAVGRPPGELLFFTDIIEEARAARDAGVDAVLSLRAGNKPLPDGDDTLVGDSDFPRVSRFDDDSVRVAWRAFDDNEQAATQA